MEHQQEKDFFAILNEKNIKSVYQPIVSLKNGTIFGYEALSRITMPNCTFNIEQLFRLAAQLNKLWELEKLCRIKALMHAKEKPLHTKLFLNVDPNNIYDPKFQEGFTCEMLQKYGFHPNDIIFEVTEKSSIHDMEAFREVVNHYRKQHYHIAVDDFGAGYSGLNRICSFFPNFIKIDMELIRNIQDDAVKKSAVGSIVKLCQDSGIHSIAEGIESEEELCTLIRLGIDYGQGFFLAKPSERFEKLACDKKMLIKEVQNEITASVYQPSVFGFVKSICTAKPTVLTGTKAVDVYHMMKKDPTICELGIIDAEGRLRGILTRRTLLEKFSGRYGYTLHCTKHIENFAETEYLVVDWEKSVDELADIAMKRSALTIYDAVFVTKNGKYFGVVTVKDLLNTAIKIQVKRASEASPLTGLPGNAAVQSKMLSVSAAQEQHTIIYLDLDNFKAYNDAYSFTNGDKMIRVVAETMRKCCAKEDFLGHIGGDDFVIVTRIKDIQKLCKDIIEVFSNAIMPLYSKEDWSQGYIVSTNRNGFVETFPIATLSIAAVKKQLAACESMEKLSQKIAQAKKKSKQIQGNSVVYL